jgi:hypothetical protein
MSGSIMVGNVDGYVEQFLAMQRIAMNGDATTHSGGRPGFGATRGPSTSLRFGRDDDRWN